MDLSLDKWRTIIIQFSQRNGYFLLLINHLLIWTGLSGERCGPWASCLSSTASSSQLNMRGMFLHVLGHALGSVVVIISALIIWVCEGDWKFYVDPAMRYQPSFYCGNIRILCTGLILHLFSSPEPEAQVSFSDQNVSVVRRGHCCWRKLFTFSSSSPGPLSKFKPNLAQNILGWRGYKFCQIEDYFILKKQMMIFSFFINVMV